MVSDTGSFILPFHGWPILIHGWLYKKDCKRFSVQEAWERQSAMFERPEIQLEMSTLITFSFVFLWETLFEFMNDLIFHFPTPASRLLLFGFLLKRNNTFLQWGFFPPLSHSASVASLWLSYKTPFSFQSLWNPIDSGACGSLYTVKKKRNKLDNVWKYNITANINIT